MRYTEKLRKYKIRFFLFVEQILAFALYTNLFNLVKNVLSDFKQIK